MGQRWKFLGAEMGLVREISIGKHKDAPRYLQTALTDGSAVKSSQYTVRCVTCAVCDVQLFITRVAMVQLMQGLVGRGQR